MAMFGGRRRGVDLGAIGNLLLGSNEVARRRMLAQDTQDRALAEQRRMAETTIADRLRSQLSPMDGPNGSGTGAMPSIDQQVSALDRARLLNPEVASQFAPVVQSRRMEAMTASLPPEQRMAIMLNPEQAGASYASQFKDETLSEGSIRTRGGTTVAAAPVTDRFDDRFGTYNPITGQTSYSQPRGETFQERTGRMTAERPQIANLGLGDQAFGVGLQGQVQPLAQNSQPRPIPEAVRRDNEKDQMAIDDRTAVIARLDNAIGLIQNDMINLDPMSRASAWVRNNTGNSSPQSQAAAELRRTVESLRNSILNDATGPQTDGDSLRALNQIIQGWGDETVVMQGIQAYRDIQARKTESQRRIMAQREAQYGGQGQPQAGPQGQGGPRPRARNPQTGQVVEFNGSQWVPVQ